jgi:hypothetical protein
LGWYDRQLTTDGWQFENTGWQKDTPQGLFGLYIEVYTNTQVIKSNQDFYKITEDALKHAREYPTAYVLDFSLISHESLARCFRE